MVQIFYKKVGSQYRFCATNYSFDKEYLYHYLEVFEGFVGMGCSCEPVITQDYIEIEIEYNRIKQDYPDKQPETQKIKLIVDLKEFATVLSQSMMLDLLLHIWSAVKSSMSFSGQGVFDLKPPNSNTKLINKKYIMELEVIEKYTFYNEFFIYTSPCGLKVENIRIEDN